ncbi:MAG: hypothetical protein AAF939_16180 [Planctomycetota bacterium]
MRFRHRTDYNKLENRNLLAGDVLAFQWGSDLFLRGDQENNSVEVFQQDNGDLAVVGLDGTTINGTTNAFVIQRQSWQSAPERFRIDGGIDANLGDGDDSFLIRDLEFADYSQIYGGTGHDQITVSDSHFENKLFLQTYLGDDVVNLNEVHFEQDFYLFTLAGNDWVNVRGAQFEGDSVLVSGEGDDHIGLFESSATDHHQLILTLGGNDLVQLDNPEIGSSGLGVYSGDGADRIEASLNPDLVSGRVVLDGQSGHDAHSKNWNWEFTNQVFEVGFEAEQVHGTDVSFDAFTMAYNSYFANPSENHFWATDVTLQQTTQIQTVQWTGSYVQNDPPALDDFVIDIYEGDETSPLGKRVASFDVGNDVNRTSTGAAWDSWQPNTEFFSYRASVDFTMEAGKTYWVSIYSNISNPGERSGDEVGAFQWRYEYRIPSGPTDGFSTVTTQAYDPATDSWQYWTQQNFWKNNPYYNLDLQLGR